MYEVAQASKKELKDFKPPVQDESTGFICGK
jgi:hypothetical protein